MKLIRFLYYGGMLVLLLLGIYTGFSIFYTALFTQVLLLLAVFLIDLWTVRTFCYSQKLEHTSAVKGSETVLRIRIHNEKPIPMSLMEIDVKVVAYHEKVRIVFSLAPYDQKEFTIPVTMPYRGSYSVGMTAMRITDIFGLMTLRFDMRKIPHYSMASLLIYPKAEPLDAAASRSWDTKHFGAAYLKQAEQGDSISGMRGYRSGDSLKRVHWKNSVRHGELYVKQYDTAMRETALILLDSSTKGLAGEDALYYADTMCECAASIALYTLARGRSTKVAAYDAANFSISECSSDMDFDPIYTWLARLRFGTADRLNDTLDALTKKSESTSSLFVLTRNPSIDLITRLSALQDFMESVTLILIDDESAQYERLHTLYVHSGDDVVLSLGNFA